MSTLAAYKKTIITTIITVLVGSAIPGTIWLHNAYADERYVSKPQMILAEIRQIDMALFEIEQEISFAEDNTKERRKYVARKEYYQNLKAEAERRLVEATRKK